MSWKPYDADKRPGGVFLVAAPSGADESPGYEVKPGRTSASGKVVMWNGEPIPADSLIFEAGPVPTRTVKKQSGTRVIEDGEDKGPLRPTASDRKIADDDNTGMRQPEPARERKPAAGDTMTTDAKAARKDADRK